MILKAFLSSVTKSHTEKRILNTHPLHLFRIIQDVDQYSRFLPLCAQSQVLSRSDDGRCFKANLTVGFPPLFEETYTSLVTIDPINLIVETKSIQSNLFDSLQSRWKLEEVIRTDFHAASSNNDKPIPSCHVDFEVTMSVSDPFISATLDQVLREVAKRQVEAFDQRCKVIQYAPDVLEDIRKRRN